MKYAIGIDEVGRGPLAGPVTVCIVSCDQKLYTKLKKDKKLPPLGKDSKKLSPESRQKYVRYLKHTGLAYMVVNVSNKVIDNKGISFAINTAIKNGFEKLKTPTLQSGSRPNASALKINPGQCRVLLDGGLKAPKEFKSQKTIIKGDEKEKIIAWASVLAKVSRDALMCKLAKKYPKYGLEEHKGYGTRKHLRAIKKYGLSDIHRMSFCRNI